MSACEGHGILLHHVGCTDAAAHWPWIEVVVASRKPMVGTLVECCARAASGHAAAAPPRSVMKSRRLKAGMGSPHPVQPVSRTLSLAWKDWLVLGATLNRSELRCWACPRELSRLIALDELRIVLAQRLPKHPMP